MLYENRLMIGEWCAAKKLRERDVRKPSLELEEIVADSPVGGKQILSAALFILLAPLDERVEVEEL